MNRLISIVISLYNSENYILNTLESVANQNYTNYECIIIDDGSTDNSCDIVKKFIDNKSQFTYYYKENTGVCDTRNIGAHISKGDYLLFLDSDDLLHESFCRVANNLMNENDLDLVVTKVNYFGRINKIYLPNFDSYIDFLHGNKIMITSLMKRDNFMKVGGFDLDFKQGLEDWEFWLKYLYRFPKFLITDKICLYYRIRSFSRNSIISTEINQKYRYLIWDKNKELFSGVFLDPTKTVEYESLLHSKEYRLGTLLLKPIRNLINIYNGFKK